MTVEHRKILLDAARSIKMMLARDEMGMQKMTPEVVANHRKNLTELTNLLQCDLNEPDFKLELEPDG